MRLTSSAPPPPVGYVGGYHTKESSRKRDELDQLLSGMDSSTKSSGYARPEDFVKLGSAAAARSQFK